MEKHFMPTHDSGKTKDEEEEEQGKLMEAYLEREGLNDKVSAEDAKLRSQEIGADATIGSNDFEVKSGTLKSTDDIVAERLREMDDKEVKAGNAPESRDSNPSNELIKKPDDIENLSPEEGEKRRKELDEAVSAARMNFAKKDYEATHILARLKNRLSLKTRPGNLQENHDLYNQYQICLNDRLQFDIEELKSKNLSPDEFKKEAEKLAKYYNQDEKANLYNAHTDARAKVWEEKFGKAGKASGWIAEKSGKFVNWYRKANWKGKLAFSIGAGLSGAGLLIAGQRILGGAATGVGIHGALESRYRKKEETRLQGQREKMVKDLEETGEQEKKCEMLMQMLQNEVSGFQKDLQRERKGAFRRKALGASVAVLIGSGKLAEFVKWGMTETNAAEHMKSAWVGLVGQKFADQVSDKFGEIGKVLKGAYDSAGEKIPGMAKGVADSFGKHYAAGLGIEGAAGSGIASEFGEGVVPSHGSGVAYPGSPEHIEPVGKISNLNMEKGSGQGGGISSEFGEGVAPSHGAEVVYPESRPGGGMTQFEQDMRKSDLVKGNRPGSGMTQFEQDMRNSDLVKGKPSGSGLGETYTENSLKMDKGGVKYGVSSEYGEGVVPSQGEGVAGKNDYYDQLKKAYDQKPKVDLSQKAPDLQNIGGLEENMPGHEPIGKVSNIGMEQRSDYPLHPSSENINKALVINKGSSFERTLIDNLKANGVGAKEAGRMAHRMALSYAEDQAREAAVQQGSNWEEMSKAAKKKLIDGQMKRISLVHPGAQIELSPDGSHVESFHDSQPTASKGQIHEQKAAKHSHRIGRPKIDHVPENPITENIPEAKPVRLENVSNQIEGMKEIEMKNNSLVSQNAELKQKIARLSEQIKSDKQSLALGKDYPGQIRSGPSLKEMVAFREESLGELEKQMASNDAMIEELQKEYANKIKNASPENISKNTTSSEKIASKDALFQEKLGTVKSIRQEMSGGNLQEWNKIQNQPASVILRQPDSPATTYYNYIVRENPQYTRYIRPRRNELFINWTARLADYHFSHRGRFANFNISLRGY